MSLVAGEPRNKAIASLNRRMASLDKQIAKLSQQRMGLVSKCEHHFVSLESSTHRLEKTLVRGVYYAGIVCEQIEVSDITFALLCSECGTGITGSLAERCPLCGGKVSGIWDDPGNIPKYFGERHFGYNGLWLVNCSSCKFRAAGLRYDR